MVSVTAGIAIGQRYGVGQMKAKLLNREGDDARC